MNRDDLSKMIAVRTGVKVKDAKIVVASVFNILAANLKAKQPVIIQGLGQFRFRHMKERNTKNPLTGKVETVPAHDRLVFIPTRSLRKLVK